MIYKDKFFSAEYFNSKNVLKIIFSEIEPDEVLFDNYLKFLDNMYQKNEKLIFVYDSSKAKYLSSELRVKLGSWFKTNSNTVKKYNHHTIFIINSMMIRFVLNAIFVVEKPVYKYDIVKSMEEAQVIIDQKLQSI